MGEYLTKESWGKPSLRTDEVDVAELGGKVRIRELPAEYSADVASNVKLVSEGREQVAKVDTAKMELLQFTYGVIDSDGEQMFSEDEVKELMLKHGSAFKTVIAAIDNLSGIDKKAIEETEARFPARGESEEGAGLEMGSPTGGGRPAVRA